MCLNLSIAIQAIKATLTKDPKRASVTDELTARQISLFVPKADRSVYMNYSVDKFAALDQTVMKQVCMYQGKSPIHAYPYTHNIIYTYIYTHSHTPHAHHTRAAHAENTL